MYLYNKIRNMKSKVSGMALMFVAIVFISAFCRGRQKAAPPMVEQQLVQDSLSVVGYSIHRVKLPYEHEVTDQQGNKRRYSEAWLIKVRLQNAPRPSGERIDFAIGDYMIPEYGSWEGGIYFRIYERALLEQLDQKMIRYRAPGSDEMITSGQRLDAAMDTPRKVEDEKEVLERE
jgi:hypothetical protein